MQPKVARFFSFTWAAAATGLASVGVLLGLLVVWYVTTENRLSIGVSLLSLFFLALGVALGATRSFPKGCGACKRPFTETGAAFSFAAYDHVVALLNRQDAAGLASLGSAPASEPHAKTTLLVSYCEGCRRLGEARVAEEVSKGDYFESRRTAGPLPLGEAAIAGAVYGIDQRAALFRA